jgi:calcium-dependent protein kinase
MKTINGSETYTAPEILNGKGLYGCECDVWSLGVVAYVMLAGMPPFWGNRQSMMKQMATGCNMQGSPWTAISPSAKDFIRACLVMDPTQRASIESIRDHAWFKSHAYTNTESNSAFDALSNVRHFSAFSPFRSLCTAAVARQLDHTHLRDLRPVFNVLDSNGDGMVSLQELVAGYQRVFAEDCPEEAAIEQFFKAADLDGSGQLDYTEFCAASMGRKADQCDSALWSAFRQFDLDGTSCIIRASQLMQVVQNVSGDDWTETAQQLLDAHDANGDGYFDFEDWRAFVCSDLVVDQQDSVLAA